ncbi:alpha/beta-hydrolase [Cylindrobasidium torrendii FP15055 ss-10]|uniref:Carboxypeptidase n=1 Tax=Cylindrobasidium torrendii FP15055 ss-10 TaxID=1314674 RepID=A0A0D7BIU8_9AGAR|nr:alpha/beta-hydrolase [Cylindrobasidium torrendii FP15055 ss-10]
MLYASLWAWTVGIIASVTRAADLPSAASFYVPSLPDIHQDPDHPLKIFAGHIPSDPNAQNAAETEVTPHLFFVLVKNRRAADRERVLFWFNGGPGCSSFDGLMMENGPWRMDGKGGFKVVEGGWEEYTTMVYVDQPAGTGFSYTSTNNYVHDFATTVEQFLEFLRNFYKIFPEYRNVDTYLAGESYAGQYIPYFADGILSSNAAQLKGVAIGNGWIDARSHYPSYIDYLVKMGVLEENSDYWKESRKATDECMEMVNAITDHEPVVVNKCEELLYAVSEVRHKKKDGKDMCMNIYDVRLDDEYPACGMNWPPDIKPVTDYLDRDDVVRALHAEDHSTKWVECRGSVHMALHEKTENSSISILPSVLERIPVLLFVGDQDIICNYVGMENMIAGMTWNGAKGLGTVQTQNWNVNGSAAGTWVESRNLTYAKIFDSSHMVPFDLPHTSHDMILRFMGMDFSKILEGSARIASSVGDNVKPVFIDQSDTAALPTSTKSPQQDKAMWEAYYNAGSAALVLVVVGLLIGLFLCWRMRRNQSKLRLPMNNRETRDEEHVPLAQSMSTANFQDDEVPYTPRAASVKGKERAMDPPSPQPIFDVGDSDEEDEGRRR